MHAPTPKPVQPTGHPDAPIVLIGEAPAYWELKTGQPFMGPSGHLLGRWWSIAGLARSQFWIDNVYRFACPGWKIERGPRDEVNAWAETLPQRLTKLTHPKLIVPTGNVALRALLGQPLWANRSAKIGDWRGSVFMVQLPDGRQVKCIPTIHPAATFADRQLVKLCIADWRRIGQELQLDPAELYHPCWTCHIPPVPVTVINRYRRAAQNRRTVMAIDIECPRQDGLHRLACVGFSYLVDTSDPLRLTGESITLAWPDDRTTITELCQSPCIKVGQNFLFDRFWLHPPSGWAELAETHWLVDELPAIRMGGTIWDLLAMHHQIDSTLPHDLATQASLYTRQPYWKRSWKETNTTEQEPFDQLCRYNGNDCCITRALFDLHTQRLMAAA
jgi:uracil-DNA glycosylase family 4